MSLIPSLTPRKLLGVLLRAGFKIIRQKGSHVFLEHFLTKRKTMIAMHAPDLSRKIISKILNQAGLSIKEFLKFLGK